ncbi:MAG: cation diffusion facilitator family transporter [Candidatus Heimdallarchaeota archaeon]|nr:cation diffusion facilitator family transporter [Candidatus Heimdallarchaeota archaeon]
MTDKQTLELKLKQTQRITVITLILNLLLAVAKIIISVLSGSISLLADGFDSALDLLTTILSFYALKIASAPADEDHHWGQEKYENLFTLGISAVLFISSGIIAYQAINKLIIREITPFSLNNVIIAFISIIVKGLLVWLNIHYGKKLKSKILVANGMNFRTDILMSFVVLLSVSVSHLTIKGFSLFWVDPIIALIISIFIIITAIGISRESFEILLDLSPDEETLEEIMKVAREQEGVKGIHNLRARTVGSYIISDMHIYVDPNITVEEAHTIAEDIVQRVKEELPVKDLLIHVEPFPKKD